MRWLLFVLATLVACPALAQEDPMEDPTEIYVDGSGQFAGDVSLDGGFKLFFEGTDTYAYSSGGNLIDFYLNNAQRVQFQAALAVFKVNINATKVIYDGGGALALGTDCTTSHSLVTGDVCFGSGAAVEFDDAVFVDSYLQYGDDVPIYFGSTLTDAGMRWSTQQTNDALLIYVETGSANQSGNVIFTEEDSKTLNFGFPARDEAAVVVATQKGAGLHVINQTESLTFAGDPGDATKTTATLIPDGALLLGVSTRVTTAGTNCSAYYVGTAGDPDHFADDATTAVAQGTDTDNTDATTNYYTLYYPATADTAIVITGTDGSDGATNCYDMVVEVTTSYIDISAATQN